MKTMEFRIEETILRSRVQNLEENEACCVFQLAAISDGSITYGISREENSFK